MRVSTWRKKKLKRKIRFFESKQSAMDARIANDADGQSGGAAGDGWEHAEQSESELGGEVSDASTARRRGWSNLRTTFLRKTPAGGDRKSVV